MENQLQVATYKDFKESLDTELKKSAEGFVRIGYLLKMARDSDVLKESGYSTVTEFAKAEYGLTPDVVSRWIAINDRYSEGGYSERLQERYTEFGVAKLAEMLTLPEAVADVISPEHTRQEIQEIKKEIKEEEKTSDIEILMQQAEGAGQPTKTDAAQPETELEKAVYQFYREHPDDYLEMAKTIKDKGLGMDSVEAILDIFAPSGIITNIVRIKGIGALILTVKVAEHAVTVTKVRDRENIDYTIADLIETIMLWCNFPQEETAEAAWEFIYGEKFPELAPVQEEQKPEPKKQERVKTPPKEKPKPKPEPKQEPAQKELSEPEEEQYEKLVENAKQETIEVEVIPGVKAEITDFEKTSEAARMEETRAEMEAIGQLAPVQEPTQAAEPEVDADPEVVTGEVVQPQWALRKQATELAEYTRFAIEAGDYRQAADNCRAILSILEKLEKGEQEHGHAEHETV